MRNQNEMYRDLAREYAWNLLFAAIGLGAGLGVHTLLQVVRAFPDNQQAVSIMASALAAVAVGVAMAVFLRALKRVVVEDLIPAFRTDSADRFRGVA